MSRFEELARLKELEVKATPGKWFVEDCKYQWDLYAENHDLEGTFPPDGPKGLKEIFETAHPWKLISANKNGYWPEGADSDIIPALRNAAPWLLQIAEAFQPGDVQILTDLSDIIGVEALNEDTEESTLMHQAADCLRRLQAAAEVLES